MERWRVPVRIDFAGGTLDLWPLYAMLGGGVTVNAAIDLWVEIDIIREGLGHSVSSHDLATSFEVAAWPKNSPEPALGWVWRVLDALPQRPAKVSLRSPIPKGSGLGTSSCLAVGLVGAALNVEAGEGLAAWVPRLRDLEAQELQTPTGWQDYYPAALGGCLALHWDGPQPRWESLEPHPELLEDLIVFYTGAPHHSGLTNWEAYRRFIEGDRETREALTEIGQISREMVQAIPRDPQEVGALLEREGTQRKRLSPAVETDAMRAVRALGQREGWFAGMKPCGAGGGGCCLLVARPGTSDIARHALAGLGLSPLDLSLSSRGVHRLR